MPRTTIITINPSPEGCLYLFGSHYSRRQGAKVSTSSSSPFFYYDVDGTKKNRLEISMEGGSSRDRI